MRTVIVLAVALCVVLAVMPAHAQDAEALRRELEQMRKNFEAMQEQYQKSMEALSERLQRLETPRVVPAAPAAPVAQAPPATPSPGTPSPMDLLRPRQPFSLYTQRAPGQFLVDMGVTADFIGNIGQRNVDKADAGTFAGRENRFFPREVELGLFGQIDPYASGLMIIEAGEEEAGGEIEVRLAEAYMTLLTLPFNTQVRLGQMRNRFGLLNELHRHALPQPDVPTVLLRFFGEEGLVERGAELTWVAPLPFYLELLAGIFNGDNEDAFGRDKLTHPLVTGRVRTFFEITDEHALQLGASVASGFTSERHRSTIAGIDVKYKYRPDGWLHPLFTLGGEALWSIRRHDVLGEATIPGEMVDTDGDGVPDTQLPDEVVPVGERRTRHRFGYYAWAEVQPFRRWAFGVRYDKTQFPVLPGHERAVEPYVTFWASDFLRFRLAYKNTERTHRDGFSTADGSARKVDELFFQATFVLGAHPAHPF
jgi:hypothetical protein